jgi:membrane-associated phospholipid phosphatase
MQKPGIAFLAICLIANAASASGKKDQETHPFFTPSPEFFDPGKTTEPEPAWTDESPNLFRQIGTDFRNVFTTKDNLLIVGAGLGAAWAASSYDEKIPTSRFNSELFEESTTDAVFEAGNVAGGAVLQVGGAFAAFGVGKLLHHPEVEALGRDLVRAQILTQSLTQVIKLSVGRTRPDGSNNHSFPSGHSAGTFATATVLQRRYGWRVGVTAYGIAAYVAASRLSENKHYLSDVIFGAAIGIMGGRTVTVGRGPVRFALTPMIPPGGGIGIQATLLPRN